MMKSYASFGISRSILQVLYALRARKSAEHDMALLLMLLKQHERLIEQKLGRPLRNQRLLEVGVGQGMERARYFGIHNEVIGMDLDVIPNGLDLDGYIQMIRKNGFGRFFKTIGRRVIIAGPNRRGWIKAVGTHKMRDPEMVFGDICQTIPEIAAFDVAMSWSVFEHLPEPRRALEHMVKALRPGGVLFISIHLYTSNNGHHDIRAFTGRENGLPPWGHLRRAMQGGITPSAYLNQWRLPQWRDLFLQVTPGYDEYLETYDHKYASLITDELRKELCEYTDEELLTVDAIYVWQNHLPERNSKVALILGGAINAERRAAALQGTKPRIDVLELEKALDAQLLDYGWFEQRAKQEWITRLLWFLAKRLGKWSEFLCLRAVGSTRKMDVVYATGEDVGLPLAILLRLLHFKSPRLILRTEQPIFGRTRFRRFLFAALFRFAIKRVDAVLCRTRAHTEFLQQQMGLSPAKVLFSPETTDTIFFNRSAPSIHFPFLSSLPKPYLISAGLEMRDYDTLISAVRGLPITALICAGSPWAKVSYRVSANHLPPNVIVRSFSQTEMRELYRSAAFVVVPIKPTQRACGMNVVLEAWAMGHAVIASHTEGLTSYIQDQVNGYFVSPENEDELRNAIAYFIANPGEVKRLGQNGYRKVTEELRMERYLDAVTTIITRVNGEAQ